MEVNVAICCQVQLYAEGMRKLLEEDEEIHVVCVAVGKNGLECVSDTNPDIIVTDLDNCKKVIGMLPDGEKKNVLLIDDKKGHFNGSDLNLMITDGLGGLLPTDSDGAIFRKAVKKLSEGQLWIDHKTLKDVFSAKREVSHDVQLTKKEKQILDCICKGLTNKEIARKLFISEQTVKSHCNHLFKKFGVSSRLKLAVQAPKYLSENKNIH